VRYPITMRRKRWRRRVGGTLGRPRKGVMVGPPPYVIRFQPTPQAGGSPVVIDRAEAEALRLVDLEDLSLEEAGERMGVSRTTVWRFVKDARKKLAQALFEGNPIEVEKRNSKPRPRLDRVDPAR